MIWPIQAAFILATCLLFLAALVVNTWLFQALEFVPGINWVYLPAGVRLLCTLLFAEAGAIGLVLVSIAVSALYFFPHDLERALVGGVIGGLAPWLVYRAARHFGGLSSSLANLSSARLLALCVAYALGNSLLHHVYFALDGQTGLAEGFVAMFVGDLNGSLLVLYGVKALLVLLAPAPRGA
ncbi:hypothetical protein WG922_13960 [Ramlibacter sp. AN1015]|uniref:hypothetical protein n=1 Tax=Ramlibacter sp. AN1015 TaxID=3133428 RepID=UPI0030BE282A